MDALSEVIAFLRPTTAVTGVTEAYAPWGLEFTNYDYVKFGFVSEGACWLSYRGKKDLLLEEGDAWILIKPLVFRIGSEIKGPTVRSTEFFKKDKTRHIAGKANSKSLKTVIFGGGIFFDPMHSDLILENLPPVIILKKNEVTASLKSIMAVLQHETQNSAIGSKVIIETLIQLIFIEAIRTLEFKDLKIGLLKGLSQPDLLKVIQSIHKDFKKAWTVEDLAKVYGSSRSSFAAHFKSTLGMSPMEYLQRWRMLHAKESLKSTQLRISEIAYAVGYESVTAFSTAFSKVVGQAPKSFRENSQTIKA